MKTTPKILVTGPELHKAAISVLETAGYDTVGTPSYPTEDLIVEMMAKERPVGVLSRVGRIGDRAMDASPGLQVISKHGAGFDNIDIDAASARNIPVFIAPGANAVSVAEHAITLLLATIKQIVPLNAGLKAGRWEKSGFCGREVSGMLLGLVGFGSISRATAKLAQGIGMEVCAYDPFVSGSEFQASGVTHMDNLDELLASCDAVSLHCPLVPATRHILNAERLAMMRSGSFVVNAARGGVIDEVALIAALQSGHIAGAGLDSFEAEPLPNDDALLTAPNLILTPHIGGSTEQALLKVGCAAAEAIVNTLSGVAPDEGRIVNSQGLVAS